MKKSALLSTAPTLLETHTNVVQSAKVISDSHTFTVQVQLISECSVQKLSLLIVACVLEGIEYEAGSNWQPEGPCSSCTCVNGEALCTRTQCPPTNCQHPTRITGKTVCIYMCMGMGVRACVSEHERELAFCRSCTCTNGKVHCKRKRCPFAHCSHPIIQDCCRTCEGTSCSHENLERANGETWDDRSDPCVECVCRDGSVQCRRKRCPASNCNHPVQRQCCMSCDGCMFNGREYLEGSEFSDGRDPCAVCQCYRGDVTCTKIPCNEECSHPYKPPGQCCGECERAGLSVSETADLMGFSHTTISRS
uniref:VWFC domain-containing protein n=1 Tax=Amphilophus citrinellus TaxID=61819 RepID=A0A3Q0SWD6_AMPCI